MSVFGVPSRLGLAPSAPMLHPAVSHVQQRCPTRQHVLHAACFVQMPPPEKAEIIFKKGYDLFFKLCIGLPKGYREKGEMLETAFRPLLDDALEALERLPTGRAATTQAEAQSIIKAYVCAHWVLGAREAAMVLYSATD